MKHLLSFLSAILVTLTFASCHPYEEWDDSAEGNFDALWTILDEHYCFFDEKDIDWNEVGQRYRARLVPGITQQELFALCTEMIDELEDGHTNLISPFDISYYDQWWTDYPQDFDIRVLQEHYLGFDYKVSSGIYYKIMPNNIGYIYYPSFSSTIGEGATMAADNSPPSRHFCVDLFTSQPSQATYAIRQVRDTINSRNHIHSTTTLPKQDA